MWYLRQRDLLVFDEVGWSSMKWGGLLFAAGLIIVPAPPTWAQSRDFNGDGFADLAIGVPSEHIGGHSSETKFDSGTGDEGGVNVLYGSAGGLQATGTGGPDDQLWGQDSPGSWTERRRAIGSATTLAAGDFNRDGFADLAIGVPSEDTGGRISDGSVNVLYGSAAGLQATGSGGLDDQLWGQDSPGVEDTAEEIDQFGTTLAAGDFNGDGFADLAIGVPSEDTGGRNDDGSVNVLYGSAGGLQATGTGPPDDQLWGQDSPGVEDPAEEFDQFGTTLWLRAISTAMVFANSNHWGSMGAHRRALFGAKFDSGTGYEGGVNVLYGWPGALQATGTGGPDDQLWGQDSPGVLDEAESTDVFGLACLPLFNPPRLPQRETVIRQLRYGHTAEQRVLGRHAVSYRKATPRSRSPSADRTFGRARRTVT